MKEMWDASNPDMPHQLRSEGGLYPIDDWYGAIVDYDENGEKYADGRRRLVAVTGNSIQMGKDNQTFAYIGGSKTHPSYRKKGLMGGIRQKNLQAVGDIPKIASYSTSGQAAFSANEMPETHEVIPDSVLEEMNERVRNVESAAGWSIVKWMRILRKGFRWR